MREKLLEVIFIILALVFAAVGYDLREMVSAGFRPTSGRPEDLRVVSWNVGGAGGYGGRSLTDEYLPHIAGVLKKLNADLILLQEVASSDQVRRLSRQLGGAVGNDNIGGRRPSVGNPGTARPSANPGRISAWLRRPGGLIPVPRHSAGSGDEHPCGSFFGQSAQLAYRAITGRSHELEFRSFENNGRRS